MLGVVIAVSDHTHLKQKSLQLASIGRLIKGVDIYESNFELGFGHCSYLH